MYQFEKHILDNGVRLIIAPMDTRKTNIYTLIKNGAQYERKSESGISHFDEHYLFRGTKKLSDFRAIEELLQGIQAVPHAHTDYEEVCYSIECPVRNFLTALNVISELLTSPTFNLGEVSIEQDMVIQEMGTWLDRPAEYLQGDLWPQVCFGDQPAGRPVIGTEETVRSFTAEKMEKWFRKHYVGDAVVVVVAGGKDIQTYFTEIKEAFSAIRPGKARNPFLVKDNQKFPNCLVLKQGTNLTHVHLGVKTPYRWADKGGYAAMILAQIVNTNLFYSMVGDRGLAYERHTEYRADSTKSFLSTYAGVTHSRTVETIRIILAEYRKIREIGITNKELNNVIEYIIEELKEHFEDEPAILATFFADDEFHTNVIRSPDEELEMIKAVSRRDVQEVAQRIFHPENLNLAVIGPHEDDREFNHLLRNF